VQDGALKFAHPRLRNLQQSHAVPLRQPTDPVVLQGSGLRAQPVSVIGEPGQFCRPQIHQQREIIEVLDRQQPGPPARRRHCRGAEVRDQGRCERPKCRQETNQRADPVDRFPRERLQDPAGDVLGGRRFDLMSHRGGQPRSGPGWSGPMDGAAELGRGGHAELPARIGVVITHRTAGRTRRPPTPVVGAV